MNITRAPEKTMSSLLHHRLLPTLSRITTDPRKKNSIPKKPSLAKELARAASDSLSIAMETNGKGFHGFIVELPGAFVRGPTEEVAASKALGEARSYLNWLGQERTRFPKAHVVQTHKCKLMVEDADGEIILTDDLRELSDQEFQQYVELSKYSGLTFDRLFNSAEFKDWVDKARIRTTFYGQNNKTIREIFDHVNRTQQYYLSRIGASFAENEVDYFMAIRDLSLETLEALFRENGNSKLYTVDDEAWTLKKVLRRFIWHDRIHGKAIVRIMKKQKQVGIIDSYEDPFKFNIHQ